ncbi:hypothetical protein J2S13_002336 [Oikeobacillus pervagus]|uniref:SLH domain-containing protein n=1 Tax=Oikeobacillus pervagus TaxID=1325931 RepID=A0AAJ1T649_9BACI|nr:S-layer homology domain-containing protein [Oikeobacillus pervagus]MDQ0215916.1 hypothetical protein [Oikeobacillus pervagus]
MRKFHRKFWPFMMGAMFLLLFSFTYEAQAHVIDLTVDKQAQANLDHHYKLVKKYKGKSGVTFESYSPKWNTDRKLQQLEQQLLRNKHGKELAYLGKIMIYPDYPNGKGVLGMYFAEYIYGNGEMRYLGDRVIHLYGGEDHPTVVDMAYTLSHEYGHHFTYYHLVQKEQKPLDKWLQSDYAKARHFDQYHKIHTNGRGDYIWHMPEVIAEDYVQLFGSEEAVSTGMQMNTDVSTPFDTPSIMNYWKKYLGNEYTPVTPLQLYITDYKENANKTYDLQLHVANRTPNEVFLRAEGDSVRTYSSYIGEWPYSSLTKWIRYQDLPYDYAGFMLDGNETQTIRLQAIQHQDKGFNTGSSIKAVPYQTIQKAISDPAKVMTEKQANRVQDLKELIRTVADEKGIPAEILKAIAYKESQFKQWNHDGTPNVTTEGKIGIMGIQPEEEGWKEEHLHIEKLKSDARYNIEAAAEYLRKQWEDSTLPKVNDYHDLQIEDWYFALMAYNGLTKENDPNLHPNGSPYQEQIFQIIRENSQIPIGKTPTIQITYPNGEMDIEMKKYNWPTQTESKQYYFQGLEVFNPKETMMQAELGATKQMKVEAFTPFIIKKIKETDQPNDHQVYYEVEGNDIYGYIPSSDLAFSENIRFFQDIERGEVARAVAFLQFRKIVNGYEDGTYRPNQKLLRRHAAKLLVNALDLKLPNGYKMKATDMKRGDLNYDEMAIAEAYGLMGTGGKLRPNEYLSRSQMASIIVRAFDQHLATPTSKQSFSDVPLTFDNYDNINRLAFNGITIANPFRPQEKVNRGQFALFLQRAIQIKEP